jgi:hypothetical protein
VSCEPVIGQDEELKASMKQSRWYRPTEHLTAEVYISKVGEETQSQRIGPVSLPFVMVRALRLVFARKSGSGPETCVPMMSRNSRCESLAKEEGIGSYIPRMVSRWMVCSIGRSP